MSGFDDRERSEEARFVHNAEFRFRVETRRNRLLGLWAAEQMGLSEEHAKAYAEEVVASEFIEAGHEDVFRKIAGDFSSRNVAVADEMIRLKMDELMNTARAELEAEIAASRP